MFSLLLLQEDSSRFGIPRPVIAKEEEEKKKLRSARFGANMGGTTTEVAERMAKRAEKFAARV